MLSQWVSFFASASFAFFGPCTFRQFSLAHSAIGARVSEVGLTSDSLAGADQNLKEINSTLWACGAMLRTLTRALCAL